MSADPIDVVSAFPEPQPSNPPQPDPRPATGRKRTSARRASDPWDVILGKPLSSALVCEFLRRRTYYVPGAALNLSELYAEFYRWLPKGTRAAWTERKFAAALPACCPKGRPRGQYQSHIGNVSAEPPDPRLPARAPLILAKEKGYSLIPADGSKPGRKRRATFLERIARVPRLRLTRGENTLSLRGPLAI